MANKNDKGYWFSLENGKHIHVGEGETPKQATEKALNKAKTNPSKGNEGQEESNEKKSTNSNKNIPHKEELEKTVNTLLKEGKNKEQIKNYLKGFNTVTYTDEMDKYVDSLVGDSSFDVEIDEDFERSFGPAPDKEDDPEGYKKYMDNYNKWQNDNFDNDYDSDFDEFNNDPNNLTENDLRDLYVKGGFDENKDMSFEEFMDYWENEPNHREDLLEQLKAGKEGYRESDKQNNNSSQNQNNKSNIPTIQESLKQQVLNGDISLDEAAKKLNRAGWFNYVPNKEQTLKQLGFDKEPNVELKKRLSSEEANQLLNRDYNSLSDEEKENLIRYFRTMR